MCSLAANYGPIVTVNMHLTSLAHHSSPFYITLADIGDAHPIPQPCPDGSRVQAGAFCPPSHRQGLAVVGVGRVRASVVLAASWVPLPREGSRAATLRLENLGLRASSSTFGASAIRARILSISASVSTPAKAQIISRSSLGVVRRVRASEIAFARDLSIRPPIFGTPFAASSIARASTACQSARLMCWPALRAACAGRDSPCTAAASCSDPRRAPCSPGVV